MRFGHLHTCAVISTALLLASCGAGKGNSGDILPGQEPAPAAISGPNSFLLFPNPQVQADGTFQINSLAYATAYYEAIDPNNEKDTLDKWKAAHDFGNSATGTETTVVFGDIKDLGYGRRITARRKNDGTMAVLVENYLVEAGSSYAYSNFNLDAAVARDPRWHIGTNSIEFSGSPCTPAADPAACNPNISFAKFYTFDPVTGQRTLTADLDGRGAKAMPGICISCHGGRGDPLTPAAGSPTGKQLFPLVAFSASQKRGDVQARLQPLEVSSFGFSATPGYTRAEQEAALKSINEMVLCSYPIAASAPVSSEDSCRRQANKDEWQGTAAALIKNMYGGDGLPNTTYADTYAGDAVPAPATAPTTSWASSGQLSLYKEVVVPACRTCHLVRGTGNQADINLDKYEKTGVSGSAFLGYADSIKKHVADRGDMPLAKLVSDKYFSTPMADSMATFLESLGLGFVLHDSAGTVLTPGRPIAEPGPDRVVKQGDTVLSAANSLYATAYSWSFTSNPGNTAVLTNPDSATPTFNATADGTYVLQLIASNGNTQSTPATLTLVVNNSLSPAPSAIVFADIKAKLQVTGGCTTCHSATRVAPNPGPAMYYTNMDRNGDGVAGDATDDQWFYAELRGRINFTDLAASPLLRKPSGYHHGAGTLPQAGFDTSKIPGDPARATYDLFLNWILNYAPYN